MEVLSVGGERLQDPTPRDRCGKERAPRDHGEGVRGGTGGSNGVVESEGEELGKID